MTWDVTMVMYRGGGLQMFSVSLSKCSWCFSNILLITFQPITFEPIDYATLFLLCGLYPLEPPIHLSRSFHSLKCTWMPYFLSMLLKLSLSPLMYGIVIEVLLVLLLLLVLLMFLFCFGVFFFNFILCMAHEGYLHAVNALSTYVNSSFSWSWLSLT